MPIYEYECEGCGGIKEVPQKISDPPFTKCETCGGKLKKIVSKNNFRLKGGGWYPDGYHKKSQKNK